MTTNEKSTVQKWIDFFIGEPKRTMWMLLAFMIAVIAVSPDLQRAIATFLWGLIVKLAIPLALLALGFAILRKKVFGGK